jgi:peptidoglycan-associated lipoprotein
VQIEGHADDRGSEEYNMALAMRRALTVQRYLVALGISPQRFETVSFGEERPSCSAPNEACWSTNRRAEFVVRGGE